MVNFSGKRDLFFHWEKNFSLRKKGNILKSLFVTNWWRKSTEYIFLVLLKNIVSWGTEQWTRTHIKEFLICLLNYLGQVTSALYLPFSQSVSLLNHDNFTSTTIEIAFSQLDTIFEETTNTLLKSCVLRTMFEI